MTVTEKTLPTINMHWRIITFRCLPKKYIVGNETDVFRHDDKSQLNNREFGIIFLDITVKYL